MTHRCPPQLHPEGPPQNWVRSDLLEGPFHPCLVIILELVLIADQCKRVRDPQLREGGARMPVKPYHSGDDASCP